MILLALLLSQVVLPDTRVEHLEGRNGIAYKLSIAVPPDFEQRPGARYPLVLLLDADYAFPLAHAIWTHLRERSDLPDLILIGIGYDGGEYKLNRTRDYTPTHVPDGGYGPEFQKASGGGPRFLEFIEKDLLPWAAARFRTEGGPVLVGHSYGALFGLSAAAARPDLFRAVIAVSPSLWYDGHRVLQAAKPLPARLYVAAGDREDPVMAADARAYGAKVPQARVDILDGETHNSIFPRALSNGLRWLWPRGSFEPSHAPGTRPPFATPRGPAAPRSAPARGTRRSGGAPATDPGPAAGPG